MQNYSKIRLLFLFLFYFPFIIKSYADPQLNVVVSIKPLYAWVSAVMKGAGKPYLLLQNSDSVHSYSLKPSDAAKLSHADLIFIDNYKMESFLANPINNLALKANIIELSRAPDVILLKNRTSGSFNSIKRADNLKDDCNLHFWLDPVNAVACTKYIADILSKADKPHAALYQENAKKYIATLQNLIQKISMQLKDKKDIKYIVFHDAYIYYENRFGLSGQGCVMQDVQHMAGAKRIKELEQTIKTNHVACIFREPQFPPSLVQSLAADNNLKIGILDPIGKVGEGSYQSLLQAITNSFIDCWQHTH